MQTYRLPDCKLWNVMAKYEYPATGGKRAYEDMVNIKPLTWPEACREAQKQLKGNAVEVTLICAGPRHPWSLATLGAYLRVLDGPKPATELLREIREQSADSREDLLLALTGINRQMLEQMRVNG